MAKPGALVRPCTHATLNEAAAKRRAARTPNAVAVKCSACQGWHLMYRIEGRLREAASR